MHPLSSLVGRPLQWRQTGLFARHYLLTAADGTEAASLTFRSHFDTRAEGCCADGAWIFKRSGIWRRRTTIHSVGSEALFGVFAEGTWLDGGTLRLPHGESILATTNTWRSTLEFRDDTDRQLVRFTTNGMIRMGADVELAPDIPRAAELPWLVILGWYLVVMLHEEATIPAIA